MTYRTHPIVDYHATLTDGAALVDVREPDELVDGSLPGAVNIPVGDLPQRCDELDRAKPVIVFCRSGGRSASAAEFLAASGYGDVTNLEGGMLAWLEAQQP